MNHARIFALLFAIARFSFAEDDSLARLLPDHPQTVSGFNVGSIVATAFGQQLLAQLKDEEPRFRQLLDLAGIDLSRDLREVMVATYARPGTKNQSLVIARGTFVTARARAQGIRNAPAGEHLGFQLFHTGNGGTLAFPGDSLAILGDAWAVREALTGLKPTHAAAASSQKFRQLSAQYDVWMFTADLRSTMASRIDDRLVDATTRYTPIFRGVNQASGGMKFGDVVTISADALMRSEKEAVTAADVLSVIASLARMAPDKLPNADFLLLLEGMRVRAEASSLSLTFSIPQAQLIRLFDSSVKPARDSAI
jgi:hypothetical protein